jgi:hypothetical protein
MTSRLEYHISVRHSIPALTLCSLLALPVLFVSTIHAQINGTPSSVTSPGFGGRPVNGPPASVTSLGPRGFAPNSRVTFSQGFAPGTTDVRHHRHHHVDYLPPVAYIPVPYAVDLSQAGSSANNDSDEADDDARPDDHDPNYRGGPTIFDRRGSGATSYIPPVKNVPNPHSAPSDPDVSAADPEPAPEPPPVPTLLIFKDGRKLELGNYAIVGTTLFDLTAGHSRRVPLADLDLEATRQQNEDRGVTFQLPPPSQAN